MYKGTNTDEFLRDNYLLDSGRAVLKRTDPEYLEDLRNEVNTWFDEVKESVKCQNEEDLCASMFGKPTKAVLAGFLEDVCSILRKQDEMVQDLCVCNDLLKSQVITCQSSLIKVQDDLLKCQSAKFDSLQCDVKKSVQNSVTEEIKSYSRAVAESTPARTSITPETLKKTFQEVVSEGDRSRNLMVFGLKENSEFGDTVSDISNVLNCLNEKPKFEAIRIGKKTLGNHRPVKVTFKSSATARQILLKSKNLRKVEQHRNVFISPDRSEQERAAHRELVLELKRRAAEDPNIRYYIRNGQVCAVPVPVVT